MKTEPRMEQMMTDHEMKGRRGFLKRLLGAFVAPKVVEALPVPAARYEMGVDMARDHGLNALRYVAILNRQTGQVEMFRYTVDGGESIRLEKMGGAKA